MQAHLFDINIPGRQTFKESDVLSPGNQLLAFDTGQLSSVKWFQALIMLISSIVICS